MIWLLVILIGFLLIISPLLRCAICHPFALVKNGLVDLKVYISKKNWHCAPYGKILCYVADDSTSFGCGKTLSVTHELVNLYNQFNDLEVWCSRRKKFVTQKIHIISNVDFLGIPYERLLSLSQFVQFTDKVDFIDDDNDTLTVTYVVIDEASSQLNCRSFKSNFDPYFISRLLTSRHVRASLYLTSQRFQMVDKLMRDCCNQVIGCKKTWRFQRNNYYDGYELENAANPCNIKALRKSCWFVLDKHFRNYDTYASVLTLRKSCAEGDMLSEEEILNLQAGPQVNMDGVSSPSRRWKRGAKSRRK